MSTHRCHLDGALPCSAMGTKERAFELIDGWHSFSGGGGWTMTCCLVAKRRQGHEIPAAFVCHVVDPIGVNGLVGS